MYLNYSYIIAVHYCCAQTNWLYLTSYNFFIVFINQINVQLFIFQTRLENWWHHDEHPEAVLVCDGEVTHYKVCRTKSIKWHVICFEFKNNGKNSIPLLSKITNITITSKELQIFAYARHSWPLNSEHSLACHTYCDTGHPFIMVISEDPWHSHLLPSVWQWSCHYLFFRIRSVATGDRKSDIPYAIRTPPPR